MRARRAIPLQAHGTAPKRARGQPGLNRRARPDAEPKVVTDVNEDDGPKFKPTGLLARLYAIRDYLERFSLEREAETTGIIYAVLSGTSFFLHGAHGATKTRHVREAARLFGMKVFDIQLSEHTKPEHVFGQADIPAMAKGIQRFKYANYAPGANFLFFDEVWSAGASVVTPMRELINEHRFNDGDNGPVHCPHRVVGSASNDIPTDPAMRSDYDRYLMRFHVEYIRSPRNMAKLVNLNLRPSDLKPPPALTLAEVDKLCAARERVVIPEEIVALVLRVRNQIFRTTGMEVSDRRFAQAHRVIQASAMFNGRATAVADDIAPLANIFWNKAEDVPKVRAIVGANASAQGADIVSFQEVAVDVFDTAMETGDMASAAKKLEELSISVANFSSDTGRAVARTVRSYLHRVRSILRDRRNLILIEMKSKEHGWQFKLAASSATGWNTKQLRDAGFHWYKKHAYWYRTACKLEADLPRARATALRDVSKVLGVTPQVRKLQ